MTVNRRPRRARLPEGKLTTEASRSRKLRFRPPEGTDALEIVAEPSTGTIG